MTTPRIPQQLKLDFARNVGEWWRSLTFSQTSDVWSWLAKNDPPADWRGTRIEWAYLNMPVPESW